MRLLLVEDDRLLGAALKKGLEHSGYTVDWIRRGDDLLTVMPSSDYAIVLLDLGLPHMSGQDALVALRASGNKVPVIVITAQDRASHKIAALDGGADDYVVKPLDLDELLARIRAHLRRRDDRSSDVLHIGAVSLDLVGRTVAKDACAVAVTAKEYKILATLMRRAGRFVSKGDLESILYDDEAEYESNTIEVSISALRRKLGREAILTTRGLGYMIAR